MRLWESISRWSIRRKKKKRFVFFCFCLLPNSMWQGLLQDPLLSLFSQSGGRHFKLQLDEVSFAITWLQSSNPCSVCAYVHIFLTWIFFFLNIISAVLSMALLCCGGSYKERGSRIFGRILPPHTFRPWKDPDGINTAISAVAASAVCQWIFPPKWRISNAASLSQCICQQREQELSAVLKRVCCICVFSLYLSFPPSKHSHCYSYCSFSFLPCLWHLTSLHFHLPFHSWSLLLLKALFFPSLLLQ